MRHIDHVTKSGSARVAAAFVAMTCLLLAAVTPAMAQPCVVPDNGTGTVNLPPEGCTYLSPDEVHLIIDGLPPGTTIELDPEHWEFFNIFRTPEGTLGGEAETFESTLTLTLTGTGSLAGFARTLSVPVSSEAHTGPRNPGDPVQTFPNEMFRLQGGMVGDPDFDVLTIRAGQDFGLPSPGETTLTQLPSGDFNVDSFFDITYQIEFTGALGSALEGMSGTTTATLRMQGGEPAPSGPDPCVVPDNGTGTVDLPPPGCEYLSPDELHQIIDGLPPGTTINIDPIHHRFLNTAATPGGSLGGEIEIFDSELTMNMTGTGALAGFNRQIVVPVASEAHTGPRNPGDAMQTFANDMASLQGSLFGDPDFDMLTVTAGTDHGLPSPGQTTLTQLPSGDFNVDSFFDITYRIDFTGAPGSALDSFGGSTTGTVRMQTGGPPGSTCPGIPPGDDIFPSTAKLVLDHTDVGGEPFVVRLSSTHLADTVVRRGTQAGQTIPIEIIALELQGFHPRLGPVQVGLDTTRPSLGQIDDILQDPDTCELISGDSFFDVFVDVYLPSLGQTLTVQGPLHVRRKLTKLPPEDDPYENPFVDPVILIDKDSGLFKGNIYYERHHVDPPFPPPGFDCFDTFLEALIEVPPLPPTVLVAQGRTTVRREPAVVVGTCSVTPIPCGGDADCPAGETCLFNETVSTELIEMELTGIDPLLGEVHIRQSEVLPSPGQALSPLGGDTYPAESFFDVFVEVDLPDTGTVLNNLDPVEVFAIGRSGLPGVEQLPPDPTTDYRSPPGIPIPLFDPTGVPVGTITDVHHRIDPPIDWQPPPPWEDYCFESWVHLRITIYSPFCEEDLWLPGIFWILRGDPVDPGGIGQEVMETLMAKAEFTGGSSCTGPLTARLRGDVGSSERIQSLAPEEFFPAESFFDVFVELDTGIGVLNTTTTPAHMSTTINALPPDDGEIYYGPGTVIPLYDETGVQIGEIVEVSHEVHVRIECPWKWRSWIRWLPGPTVTPPDFDAAVPGGGGGMLYDVVRGDFWPDLYVPAVGGGPFGATAFCFQNDGPPVVNDPTVPVVGGGFYYVSRELFNTYLGSWNSGGPTQQVDRDLLIVAPPCP